MLKSKSIQSYKAHRDFKVNRNTLVNVVSACQQRNRAEELDELSALSGTPTDWLLEVLNTHPKEGISNNPQELIKRRNQFGSNRKAVVEPPGFLQLFIESLDDFTLKILIVASFISIGIQVGTATPDDRKTAWIEGFAIFSAVMICALVTSVNNYQKERQFLKLNQVADSRKKVTVRRHSQQLQLHQDDVLVGDVIVLSEGMEIPADGYLIEANQVTVDESAMTGQSQPIKKNLYQRCLEAEKQLGANVHIERYEIPSPIILSGTRMLSGEGLMIVLVVGELSCLGKLRALAEQKIDQQTPLQEKLQKLAEDISKFGLWAAIIIVVALFVRFTVQKIITPSWDTNRDLKQMLDYIILGVTVVVVAIPEGLPLSVTLSLAFSVNQMLVDQNLVRRLEACETMGGANVICSDKTGTLTQNKMTVTEYYNNARHQFDYNHGKLETKDYFQSEQYFRLFKLSVCINSSARLKPQEKGSSTEVGMLKLIEKFGVNYEDERNKNQPLHKFPFSSKRKRMSAIINDNGELILLIKGASQIIFGCCTSWFNPDTNNIQQLSEQKKADISQSVIRMAEKSLRTLCLAYKRVKANDDLVTKDSKDVCQIQKHDLIFLAMLGVRDIPRPSVPLAIAKCRRAGIRVRMVTGDNQITAKAIATEIGLIKDPKNSLVLQGVQFMKRIGGVICENCKKQVCPCQRDPALAEKNKTQLRVDIIANMEQFRTIAERLDVLARSRPQDKYALVTGLKAMGDVVAVTGDGTNDAPALKKADVGFAMGIAGTQVARQAAAIILLDDNFNSIVKAVMWGRNIYDSIKKFVQFQLTVNVVAVVITLIGAAFLKQQIILPIQMLWINLIMDTFASLALATEPPTEQLLKRAPHSRNQYIITKRMFKHIIAQCLFQLTIMCVLTFAGQFIIPQYEDQFDQQATFKPQYKYRIDNGVNTGFVTSGRMTTLSGKDEYNVIFDITNVYSRHFTFIFNTFVMMQLFNFINARKLQDELNVFQGILNNWLFLLIIFIIIAVQIILITFGSIVFQVYDYFGLTIQQWGISVAIGAISLVVGFVTKFIKLDGEVSKDQTNQYSKPTSEIEQNRTSMRKSMGKSMTKSGARNTLLKKMFQTAEQIEVQNNMKKSQKLMDKSGQRFMHKSIKKMLKVDQPSMNDNRGKVNQSEGEKGGLRQPLIEKQ